MRLLEAKKDILLENRRCFYQAEEMESLFNIQKANNNIATLNRSFLGEMREKLLVVEWPDLLELRGEFDYHNPDMSISKIYPPQRQGELKQAVYQGRSNSC